MNPRKTRTSVGVGSCNHPLLLRVSGNEFVTKKNGKTVTGSSTINAPTPVCIWKGLKMHRRMLWNRVNYPTPMVFRRTMQKLFFFFLLLFSKNSRRTMHKQTDFVHNKYDTGPCKSKWKWGIDKGLSYLIWRACWKSKLEFEQP